MAAPAIINANPPATAKSWRDRNPDQRARYERSRNSANPARNHRLSATRYQEMLAEQDHKCAICLASFNEARVCVDHNHVCCPGSRSCGNCVRRLLCSRCNLLLAAVEDVGWMRKAKEYLDKFPKEQRK